MKGDLDAAWAHDVEAEKAEVASIAESWIEEERTQAVLGKAGWDYFQPKADRLQAIRKKLDTMRPAPAAPAPAMAPAPSAPPT